MSAVVPVDLPAPMLDLVAVALATVAGAREAALHCHWNARGPGWLDIHDLAGEAVAALDGASDKIAERISQLGGVAPVGSARSELVEFPLQERDPVRLLHVLGQTLRATSEVVRDARAAVSSADPVTAVLLDRVAAKIEKAAWKLDSGAPAAVQSPR